MPGVRPMSDHIVECGSCYAEIQVLCEHAEAADEAKRLRARLRDLERRIREARRIMRVDRMPGWTGRLSAAIDLRRRKRRK